MMLQALRGYRVSSAGELDPGFGQSGKALVQFPGSLSSLANDVQFCADGKSLVVAKVGFAEGAHFGLARLNGDGSMDESFGDGGSVVGKFEVEGESVGLNLQPLGDGRILLFGLHYLDDHHTLPAVACFLADGSLDRRFGDRGVKVVRLPGNLSEGPRDGWLPPGLPGVESCAGVVQKDGKILLTANHSYACADYAGLLIRLNANGTLDHDFNGRGFVIVRHLLMNSWLSCVQLQPDAKILVGGSLDFPQRGLIARYFPDGQLDLAFGDQGYLSLGFAGASSMITQLARGTQGQLLCVGNRFDPLCAALQGFTAGGGVDRRFNGGEATLLGGDTPGSQWTALTVQPDGAILVAGSTVEGFGSDFVLARYLPDGQLDPDFAAGKGWVRTRLGKSIDTVTAIALQGDRRILVAGHSLFGSFQAVVMRYLS